MSPGRMAAWGAALIIAAGTTWHTYRYGGSPPEPPQRTESAPPSVLLNDEGVRRLEEGDVDGAIGIFSRARSLDAHSGTIARNLSVTLVRKASAEQHPENAAVPGLLDDALKAWPENPEALDLLSAIHYRAGRYRESWELATRLSAFHPERPGIGAFVAHLEKRLRENEGLATEAGDRFIIRYSGERRLEFEGELVAVFQQEIDALTASMGIFPSDPIEILLLTDELGERAVPFDPDVGGLYDGRIRLYLGGGLPERERLLKVVRHELVHAILHRTSQPTPVWFQEGVAQMLGEAPPEKWMRDARAALAQATAGGWNMDLDALSSSFLAMKREDRALAYAASLLFVSHLVGRHGRDLVPVVASEMSSGETFLEALRTATGSDLAALREEFQRSLK